MSNKDTLAIIFLIMVAVVIFICFGAKNFINKDYGQNSNGIISVTDNLPKATLNPNFEDYSLRNIVGTFVGMIDTTSIEVEVNGSAMTFQITDSNLLSSLNKVEEGTTIQVSYFENEYGQNIVTTIVAP